MSRQFYFTTLPFFLTLFIVIFFFFPRFPGNLINWDNNPTVLTPIALVKYHTLSFDNFEEGKKKLAVDRSDLDSFYYFVVDGHHVISGYPIFSGLLLTPFYLAASLIAPSIWAINSFPNQTLIL